MADTDEKEKKSTLNLSGTVSGGGTLGLNRKVESGKPRPGAPAGGRVKTVMVEVKRKRTFGAAPPAAPAPRPQEQSFAVKRPATETVTLASKATPAERDSLTQQERAARLQALQQAATNTTATRDEPLKKVQHSFEPIEVRKEPEPEVAPTPAKEVKPSKFAKFDDAEEDASTKKKVDDKKLDVTARRVEPRRRNMKITITKALEDGDHERTRSLASIKRRRERERLRQLEAETRQKISRDVILPETITVQEFANRMAERTADVVKELMKMGVMATATHTIDADTAELVATELGHTVKRVAESDVENILTKEDDKPETLVARPPVVTIMGHVDHGKTSLLDALRSTDVVSGEAGGITQHIGAYQVTVPSGSRITFIDTPGHEAFTEMRSRGANVTDIVVLVVAADDGIMPQTIEAMNHAKSANVPIIVAINKIDKPDANPMRVKTELLNHGLVVEDMGGEILAVEVSAKQKLNLDKLEEAILLQSEILDLKANPQRAAEGIVIEAKLDIGRGPVATVLVRRGTLKVGDIFVSGAEWGRVRAILDDRGNRLESASPGMPVEVLGANGTPVAGDDFMAVDSEGRAREIADYRQRRQRQALAMAGKSSMEQMFSTMGSERARNVPIIIKADVHGSLEAIKASLEKLSTEEIAVQTLHIGVGSITESDVSLAKATRALVVGFNVRANPQAREVAKRDGIEIRYYSIIYNVIDDVKALLSGMLSPDVKEEFIGYAEIRQVFDISKSGKIAGCFVTEGIIKRGCKVRLLRDNVVIHEGSLKTLKRFKDEVKDVKAGYECGMAFENFQDIREGDMIECFEMVETARALA